MPRNCELTLWMGMVCFNNVQEHPTSALNWTWRTNGQAIYASGIVPEVVKAVVALPPESGLGCKKGTTAPRR
jgi:hypothetical protein